MTTRTAERTDEWEAVPFGGGYGGLHELADEEFSGVVVTGRTRLFMTRGSVVGVLGGTIEDAEGAEGTAREAPHKALPLLAVMQERSEEVRAKYYSEDTPLSEVDSTLEDGNFTGYVELAENVLSGDYYQVYHQGRSMSVAWVGAAERLITDEEAFGQADDEVGIFEVRPVDVDVVEIPEPADAEGAGSVAAASGDAPAETTSDDPDGGGSAGTEAASTAEDAATESTPAPADGPGEGSAGREGDDAGDATAAGAGEPAGGAGSPDGQSTASADAESAGAGGSRDAGGASDEAGGAGSQDDDAAREGRADTATTASGGRAGGERERGRATDADRADGPADDASLPDAGPATGRPDDDRRRGAGTPSEADRSDAGRGGTQHARDAGGDDVGAADLETRSLPSLDPDRTASASRQARERNGPAEGVGQVRAEDGPDGRAADPQASGDRSPHPGATSSPDAGAQGGGHAEPADPRDQPRDGGTEREASAGAAEGDAATSSEGAGGPSSGGSAEAGEPDATESSTGAPAGQEAGETPAARSAGTEGTADDATGSAGANPDAAVEAQAEAVDGLRSELDNLEGERDDLAAERDRLEGELEAARSELERLRGQSDAAGQAADAERRLSPREAIEETNVFVRYDSKGEATLEDAHAGDADRAAVETNLRLEYHTAFEAEDAAVDGEPFDDFLRETIQYRFVTWLVGELLYEIRDTGNGSEMAALYDAIPRIDRVELDGLVTVAFTEDGEEHRTQESFDVVARDRMGDPLVVANINDSRDPATDGMMTDIVTAGERVGESNESLAGAFLVTRSYFEPESLETAAEATSGGLLSRDKTKSFVNLSRKDGYHLCLVEARNREFHLTVPEL